MMTNIYITCEQEEKVVVDSLKMQIRYMIQNDDPHETVDNKSLDLASFLRVLKYYSTLSEYNDYLECLKDEK